MTAPIAPWRRSSDSLRRCAPDAPPRCRRVGVWRRSAPGAVGRGMVLLAPVSPSALDFSPLTKQPARPRADARDRERPLKQGARRRIRSSPGLHAMRPPRARCSSMAAVSTHRWISHPRTAFPSSPSGSGPHPDPCSFPTAGGTARNALSAMGRVLFTANLAASVEAVCRKSQRDDPDGPVNCDPL